MICSGQCTLEAFLAEAPGFPVIDPCNAELLGSAVGGPDSRSSILTSKSDMLRIMGDRLGHVSSHNALLLLHHSIAIPKLSYTLCTAPCFLHPELLETYDSLLKSTLSSITNVDLLDDRVWLQATLPTRSEALAFVELPSWPHLLF